MDAGSCGFEAYVMVRDKDGNPKIVDPDTLPQPLRDALTDEEYFKIYKEERT